MKAGDIVWVVTKRTNTKNAFEVGIYRRKLTDKCPYGEGYWYNKNMQGSPQVRVHEDNIFLSKGDAINYILECMETEE